MSNPKFKALFDSLFSASDDMGYFSRLELPDFEKQAWTPEEKEVLGRVRNALASAEQYIGEALCELDKDNEWGGVE